MASILRDFRFGLKLLLRNRAFSLAVLLTLGVCIGANVAIYGVIDAVVLSSLPFEQPDRLVKMYNLYPGLGVGREQAANGSADFFLRRERVEGLEEVAAYQAGGSAVGQPESTQRIPTLQVTPSFFPMLGVRAALGRTFLEAQMDADQGPTVVLTHGYWQEQFGASPDVLGQRLRIDGVPRTIVGILPEGFRLPEAPDIRLVLPLSFTPAERTLEGWHWNTYEMLGRLRPRATVEQVEAQVAAMNAGLIEEWSVPGGAQILADAGFHTVVVDAKDDLIRNVKPALFLLWGGVGFVLLIGCLNIANLMLVRSQARRHELATRSALGAERVRLARQILTEAVTMALLGGVVGIGLGDIGLALLNFLGIADLPRGAEIGLNGPVLGYTLALALGASVLFAAIPMLHLLRTDLGSAFREGGRSGSASRASVVLRNGLVTGQVALAFLLLVGAGLMLRSFWAALQTDPGFEPEGVLTARISLSDVRYPDPWARTRFVDQVLGEVGALPGVAAAGVTNYLPFAFGDENDAVIRPEDYEPPQGESLLSPRYAMVSPGYFEALGIELLEGRTFEPANGPDQPRVIVIDEWLAQRYWPDQSPLGQRMTRAAPGEEPEEADLYTVIGVVETIKHENLTADESEHAGAYYFPYHQFPASSLGLVVRAASEPASLTASIRATLTRLDPETPLFDAQTLEDRLAQSLGSRRTPMLLLLVFAGVALFLALVGIYGVLAYAVAQRTREIGIRMALGGQPTDIFGLIVKQGLVLTAAGLASGAVAAFFLVQLIQSLLFGVQPLDSLVLVSAALLLALAAAAACAIPARRATRIDPVAALVEG